MTAERPRHWLGPDLLPPHDLDDVAGGLVMTPVLGEVDCPQCIEFLRHA